jgi:glycine cleavage system pyridoxal-binding protein P
LEAIGGQGLRELAAANLARAEALKQAISKAGAPWRLAYPSSPTFNEFLVVGPGTGDQLVERLGEEGVLAGVPTTRWGGSWPDGLLLAVTECNARSDLDALIDALRRTA